ncbi:DsbA family protein [Kineococcus gynurae]|uniref:DsbA family protein n=1 Tax=Kineococcus gynurae TaxID=452979 RepID=A0ABV5LQH9_9ACTN
MAKRSRSGNPAVANQQQAQAVDAREARAAKAAALRQREKAAERRRKVTLITVATLVVVALVAVVTVLIVQNRGGDAGDGAAPAAAASTDGGMVLPGSPAAGAAPTLDVWLDYQCPVCKRFEETGGDAYVELASSGSARVVVHTLTFLDDRFGNEASQMAAEGAAAASEQGRLAEYTKVVYANQPAEEGTGYTLDQLEDYARQAQVPDLAKWRSQVQDRVFEAYVDRVEATMDAQGVQGTPTVRVTPAGGGEPTTIPSDQLLSAQAPDNLRQAVAAAGGTVTGGATGTAATPTPSAS